MNKKLLPWLITICALGLGGTAAYYSVIGLSKLFAGVAMAVIIMASFLEASKLTLATLLHSYWKKLNPIFKFYYILSLVILSIITSAGIYGMLSSGYQQTANKMSNIEAQVELVETKKQNLESQLKTYNTEKTSIDEAVVELRKGLSNNTIQYKDRETGQIITTTSSATRRALEKQLDQAMSRQSQINSKVDILNSQIFEYESEIVEIETENELANELGPLKYLSSLTGYPMDKIINWVLLIIIFVFDPLAITLVIAANFAFDQLRQSLKKNIYGETVTKEEQKKYLVEMMKDGEKDKMYQDSHFEINKENSAVENLKKEKEEKEMNEYLHETKNDLDQHLYQIDQYKQDIEYLKKKLVPGLSTFRENKIKDEINRIQSQIDILEETDDDDNVIKYN